MTIFIVLIAFAFSCGVQWPAVQCVAWVNMIREYSEMVPLAKAVEMTFSGQYPCALCKAIAEKKQSEDTKAACLLKHEKKIVSLALLFQGRGSTVAPQIFEVAKQFLASRAEPPPTPPPRLA